MSDWLNVSDVTPRIVYTATASQTVFTVPFVFFENGDLKVYQNSVLLTLDADYTVVGAESATGGTVTLLTGASLADQIMVVRDVPIEQTTHFPPSGPFDIPGLNFQFSKLVAMIQQVVSFFTRAIHFPDSETTLSAELAPAATRANKLMGFDGAGAIAYPLGPSFVGDTATGVATVDSRSTLAVTTFDISVNRIVVGGFLVPGDVGAGAAYKRGTLAGPMATTDGSGTVIWELDLSSGTVNGGWCGVGTSSDDTAAHASMVAIAKAAGVRMVLPACDIHLTDGVLFDWDYASLEGSGLHQTRVFFNPSSPDKRLFKYFMSGVAEGLIWGVLKNLSIYGTGNTLFKVALSTNNTSRFHVENILIQDWTGNDSVGWEVAGRELTTGDRVTIVASQPIHFIQNPDRALVGNLDCDFFHLYNHWIIGADLTHSLFKRDDGVNVSQMLLENGSWNQGNIGFDLEDTTSTQSSFGYTFRNIRYEQGAAGATMFKFNKTSASSKDCNVDLTDCLTVGPLLYARGLRDINLTGIECECVAATAIDADGANCGTITFNNCFWSNGILSNIVNFGIRDATGVLQSGLTQAPLPTNGEFISTTLFGSALGTWKGVRSSAGQQGQEWFGTYTLANAGSVSIPPFADYPVDHAFIEVSSKARAGGTALFNSTGCDKISGSSNFSTTSTTSTLSVIFSSSSNVILGNSLGSSQEITVRVVFSAPLAF